MTLHLCDGATLPPLMEISVSHIFYELYTIYGKKQRACVHP